MERQQYGLKVGFWNVNCLLKEKASVDLLQNEIRDYDILFCLKLENMTSVVSESMTSLFLIEAWLYKDKLDNLHRL